MENLPTAHLVLEMHRPGSPWGQPLENRRLAQKRLVQKEENT